MTTWTEAEFWEQLRNDKKNREYEDLVRKILTQTRSIRILGWPRKGKDASFYGAAKVNSKECRFFSLWARSERGGGGLEVMFHNLKEPFAKGTDLHAEWVRRLNGAGFYLDPKNTERQNFSFEDLTADPSLLPGLFAVIDWALNQPSMDRLQTVEEQLASLPTPRYPNDAEAESEPPYAPNFEDERERVLRQIVQRRGQKQFRDALLIQYQGRCAITNCQITDVLEAAHIVPYQGEKDNEPSNGILLRADIHTLFDLDLIGIHSEDGTIHLHPSVVVDSAYEFLEGQPVYKASELVSQEALSYRWKRFQTRLDNS